MFRLTCFFLCYITSASHSAALILSEYMGDPAQLPDSQGEYIEFVLHPDRSIQGLMAVVSEKGDTLAILPDKIKPNTPYLICKDSTAMKEAAISCDRDWHKLTLPNTKPTTLIISDENRSDTIQLLKPLSGKSWENTFDASQGFHHYLPADIRFETGDFGTPGNRSSKSILPPEYDIAIQSMALNTTNGISRIEIYTEQKGTKDIGKCEIQIMIDTDLNGQPDKTLVERQGHCDIPTYWDIPEKASGLFFAQINPTELKDEDISNNKSSKLILKNKPISITEVCPAPLDDFPEWCEIKNIGNVSLSLTALQLNGLPLLFESETQTSLPPGQTAVITEDKKRFTDAYGLLQTMLIEPPQWPVFKNGGDTLTLTIFQNHRLEHMTYSAIKTHERGHCLVKANPSDSHWTLVSSQSENSERPLQGTPGYQPEYSSKLQWDISPEIIDISNPQEAFSIKVSAPLNQKFNIWVYDITGYPIKPLCKNQSGNWNGTWNGKDEKGRTLPVGPYILMVQNQKKQTFKKALVLAKPL